MAEEMVQGKAIRPGMAAIKAEYIDHAHERKLDLEYFPKEVANEYKATDSAATSENNVPKDEEKEDGESEPPKKKIKLKGRNKKRPMERRLDASEVLCPKYRVDGEVCDYGDGCRYSHNIESYMENKPKDIGDKCYVFDTYGLCPFGRGCRFGRCHLTEDHKNIVNQELHDKMKDRVTIRNFLAKDVQKALWKRKYSFQRADKVIEDLGIQQGKNKNRQKGKHGKKDKNFRHSDTTATDPSSANVKDDASTVNNGPKDNTTNENASLEEDRSSADADGKAAVKDESSACPVVVTDGSEMASDGLDAKSDSRSAVLDTGSGDQIRLRPQEKKKIDFTNKLYLAPLTTVGNLPFRRICKEMGADITCGEMAMSTNLLKGQASEWALLKRHASEDLFGIQLCGSFPDTMIRCGQLLSDNIDFDFLDINCGCPIDLVFKRGEGCALMGRTQRFEQIVRGLTSVLDAPLTVKMRTGIFQDRSIAHTLVPKLQDWGVSLVTIHGRSREQRYTRLADWDYIDQCAQSVDSIPVFGNGDILSFEDALEHREKTKVSGMMLARGALIKPWLFTEIKEQRVWDISASERLDMLKRFTNYGLEHWGSDQQGVSNTRKFMLEWLSFLHRYIPVGVMERLPQKINEKPPYYFGRNDLETLMASSNSADWVKISEMLLGPVPDSFTFLPKHKANAYS